MDALLDLCSAFGLSGLGRFTGIFLDPNGPISVTNAQVRGRVFGGGAYDELYVAGSNITAPEASSILQFALSLAGLAVLLRKWKPQPRRRAIAACCGQGQIGFLRGA